jgi:arginyl-tRNA synthetase
MDFIIDATLKAVKHLYQADLAPADISLQQTRKEFEGQVTIVTFPFTKVSRKSPEQTGAEHWRVFAKRAGRSIGL